MKTRMKTRMKRFPRNAKNPSFSILFQSGLYEMKHDYYSGFSSGFFFNSAEKTKKNVKDVAFLSLVFIFELQSKTFVVFHREVLL